MKDESKTINAPLSSFILHPSSLFWDVDGTLIETGSRWNVFFGYCGAALLMLAAAVMELRFGVDAEGRALEDIAEPLSA